MGIMSSTRAPAIAGQTLHVDPAYQLSKEQATGSFQSSLNRGFHEYEDEPYSLPNDATEHQRLTLQHEMWRQTYHGGLHLAPIASDVKNVVDVGTGTGSWAIEFARAHPDCHVLGTDLSPVRPNEAEPLTKNISFVTANANEPWDFGGQQMDFIHSRLLILGLANWENYFKQAFDNLRPGGWLEVQETAFPFKYIDDGGVDPTTSPLCQLSTYMVEATSKQGLDMAATTRFEAMLVAQGFTNIRVERAAWALGPWPKDSLDKQLGRMGKFNVQQMFIPAVGMRLLPKVLGWSDEKAADLVRRTQEELDDLNKHFYCTLYLCCAQKPLV